LQVPSYVTLGFPWRTRARTHMHTLQKQYFNSLDRLKDVEWNFYVFGMKDIEYYVFLKSIIKKNNIGTLTAYCTVYSHGNLCNGKSQLLDCLYRLKM